MKLLSKSSLLLLVLVISITSWFLITGKESSEPILGPSIEANVVPWESGKWRTAIPETQGVDSAEIADMINNIVDKDLGINSLLIIRNGYMITSAYFGPYKEGDRSLTAMHSVTKSITSALTGIAIRDGILEGTDQKLMEAFPEFTLAKGDLKKSAITVNSLLRMQSGIKWPESSTAYGLNNIVDQFLNSPHQVEFILNQPMDMEPNAGFNYSTGDSHLIAAMIQRGAGRSLDEFAQEKLFGPLGITHYLWSTDRQGLHFGGTGLYLNPEDMAKIGYLYLNNGQLNGYQIIPEQWIEESLPPWGDNQYGYQWRGNEGYYYASGSFGQRIFVSPNHNLVVVMTSSIPNISYTASQVPNGLFTRIQRAAESIVALPVNPNAYQALQDQIHLAGSPEKEIPTLPALVSEISGKTYIGKSSNSGAEFELLFSLTFSDNSETAILKRTVGANSSEMLIGLDNLYRESGDIRAKGQWKNNQFIVSWNQIDAKGRSHDYSETITYAGESVWWDLQAKNAASKISIKTVAK